MNRPFCPTVCNLIGFFTLSALTAVGLTPTRAFAQGPQQPPAGEQPTAQQPPVGQPPAEQNATVAPQVSEPAPKMHLSADPPPRKIVFDAAPAPTGNNRSYHYHDGFYLRAGLNYGPGWGGLSLEDGDETEIDYSGGLLDFDLLIAGTPSPGFSVGGGLLLGTFLRPSMESDGDDVATSNVGYLMVGPFVDGYFTPQGGWHVGALAGLAALGKTPHTERALGFGGCAWIGYDAWVGSDWAVGGNLRFTAAAQSGDKPVDFAASALAISLGFSALYH